MRNSEYLLCALLDCGYADLTMLDDVGYDINDIIKETKAVFGDICFNNIMTVIFQKGLSDLEVAFADNQNRIFDEIDEEINRYMQPVEEEVSLLCEIPGIKRTSAIDILAEIGVDMEVFPTDAHIASWAGLSPGNNESAGKKKARTRTTATKRRKR